MCVSDVFLYDVGQNKRYLHLHTQISNILPFDSPLNTHTHTLSVCVCVCVFVCARARMCVCVCG